MNAAARSMRLRAGALLALALFAAAATAAQSDAAYPARPVRVVVGFPPGGPVDIQARVMMQKLSERLRQPVVIDNRPGADSVVGSDLVAKAAPDGYTLLFGNAGHITNQILHGKTLPYHAIRDFQPVGLLTSSSYLMLAHPLVPVTSVGDVVAHTRAKPGSLAFASAGNGSFAHLAGEYLKSLAKIDLVHVPYKGAAPALNDLIAGQIPLAFAGPPPSIPHIRAGRIRALATTAAKRLDPLPETPTIAESGFPGFEVSAWYGFFAPAKTSADIVARLNRELRAILQMPDVRDRLEKLGLSIVGSTPEQHAQHLQKELAHWTPVIKASGMRVD